jgi:cbb3-type cytochrome oxidase maturation protein
MTGLLFLVPIAVAMGLIALAAFLWTVRSGQYDDLDGASQRALDDESRPL